MSSYYGRKLEQKCLAPGMWRIEGYTVERDSTRHIPWSIWQSGEWQANGQTLNECREWIAEH